MTLSTHVLDTASGKPAFGVPVTVSVLADGEWVPVGAAVTGSDGRANDLVETAQWRGGVWRLVFDLTAYAGPRTFYPRVTVDFLVEEPTHYHMPLLLSTYGYSTYRGS